MPGLKYILIVLAVIIIIFVIFYINFKQKQKIKSETIDILNTYGKTIIKDKSLLFEINHNLYEILFYKIAEKHELTINSKLIWEVHTKTGSQLINQKSFLTSDYPKIIILYPIATKIKRFINENEMVFIDFRDSFFDMRLIKLADLKLALSEVEL
ncbi:hypothetical protein [Mariniplasma anaerobium]|uniref:Uncharacterized protein n=1 Tax=Mariniplasma anaerobium TaxID=2735436 RepID=A0A7U9TGQ1_9MOLU|nr:hypothetical protein [Mariniplasma anaerobium]BCR35807.1 hypothetical protein MPAN_007000 [Mariniplasma anaerobium]